MKLKPILGAILLLPVAALGDTFFFDFNDLSATSGVLQNKTGGAVAKDGGSFASATWPGVTSFIDIFGGDLTPTSPPTGYGIAQDPGNGPLNVGYGADNSGRGRYQYRDVTDFAIGTTWLSYVFDFNQDLLGDGTDALISPGLLFATSVQPTNLPTLGVTIEPSGTPGSPLTYVEWAPAGLRFDDGTPPQRGTQGPDLGLSPGDLHLVIAKLDQGADTITVWVNPPDVSSEGALGTPALTATLGITQIPAIGFGAEGTGTDGPSGDPAEDFGANFDQARFSNEPGAFAAVTTSPDPILSQTAADDLASPPIDADLNFGGTISSTGITRRVQFINNGPNNSITIEGVSILNDVSGVFAISDIADLFGDPVVLPLELFPDETISIEITFDPAGMSGPFTADLEVDTNEDTPENPQDKSVPISVTEFLDGQKILTVNPNLEATPYNSGWATSLTTEAPGIAPGSSQAARLDPAGDGYLITPVFPSVSDFTVTYYFAVQDLPGAADGDSNLLFRVRGAPFDPMVTLAYFPAGVSAGPAGWYAMDSGSWTHLPGLGTVTGSTNGENVYKMTFQGFDFGDFSYDYDVSVAGVGGAVGGGSASGLIAYDTLDPAFSLPLTLAFEQRDSQLTEPILAGLTNQVGPWIDDVCVLAGSTLPDPDLNIAAQPSFGVLFNPAGPVTDSLVLRNDGSSTLSVSDITFADSHFSITPPPSFPITIAGGATSDLTVQFDPGVDSGTFVGDITITSDDSVTPQEIVPLTGGAFSDGDKFFTDNTDFEATPFDDQWVNSGTAVAGPGLAAGSATSAYVVGGSTLGRDFIGTSDFEAQFFFAVDDSASRQLNFYVTNDVVGTADGAPTVNLRYEGGGWAVYDGVAWQALGQLNPIVGAADGANVYLLKVVGRGWGSPGATYDIFLSDLGGTTFTSAVTDLSFSHGGTPADGTPTAILFRADTGGNPGFWVDDVCVTAGAPAVDDPNFSLVSSPTYPLQLDDNSAVSSDLVVDNTGLNNTLNITAIDITGPGAANFTVLTGLPVNIVAGGQASIAIQFERGASPPGNFSAVATFLTNDATTPDIDVPLTASSLSDAGPLLANCDFELQDGTPFEGWQEIGVVQAVPGLVGGSNTAAYLTAGGVRLQQNFTALSGVGNFVMETYFAFKDVGRVFNFLIGQGNIQINCRYQGGIWYIFQTGPGWQTILNMNEAPLTPLDFSIDADSNGSLNDPGDTKNLYQLRVTCLGWSSIEPTYNFELYDDMGGLIAMVEDLSFFQNGIPSTGGTRLEFTQQFGSGTGFWVDEACVTSLEAFATGVLVLTDVTNTGDDITLNWSDVGNVAYSVERSYSGEDGSWTTIATGIGGTTFTDLGILPIAAGLGEDNVLYRVFIP